MQILTYTGAEKPALLEHTVVARPPLDTPIAPADIGKILMTVLELYNREAMATLTVYSVSLALAQVSVSFYR